MGSFKNREGRPILERMARTIQENRDYLSEIDGLIGDGDHGANMSKGFGLFQEAMADRDLSFTGGLGELGQLLLDRIGGSMGPIYGTLFIAMSEAGEGLEDIDLVALAALFAAGLAALGDIIEAQAGDKTLMDTLIPANDVLQRAAAQGSSLEEALPAMTAAAQAGRDSTRDLVSKVGRSSRLGERSRGVLDAGAVSSCLLLCAISEGILEILGS
ncbi:MAG: dihydroxyacetone kinase subunit DhaL [Treponema sp.]|nr:dihydroxyacetone kinase subunit DhaL [Treponema sp.]